MNELAEIFDEFFAVDLFDDFFEESEDHELHGDALGYAALHHIEELFFVYFFQFCSLRSWSWTIYKLSLIHI